MEKVSDIQKWGPDFDDREFAIVRREDILRLELERDWAVGALDAFRRKIHQIWVSGELDVSRMNDEVDAELARIRDDRRRK